MDQADQLPASTGGRSAVLATCTRQHVHGGRPDACEAMPERQNACWGRE
ncbi:hypothetical protein PF003_g40935 [Phytophthora fragariae]|nr:hypothetical protein PF003_g40935 [Phytophthora fragariae]